MTNLLRILQVINMIPTAIATVQALKGSASGKEKSFAVAQQVGQALDMAGIQPKDPKRFAKARQKCIDAVIEMCKAAGAWSEQ